jgi:hypothetical protein
MRRIKIYEAGPIDQEADGGLGWRATLFPVLNRLGDIVKPKDVEERQREFRKLREESKDFVNSLLYYQLAAKIVEESVELVKECDIVVAYLTPLTVTCGTHMELLLAKQLGKPVYIYSDGYRIVDMPTFLVGNGFRICSTLEELTESIEYRSLGGYYQF